MNKRIKNIVTVVLLAAFLFGFGAWAALKPAAGLSGWNIWRTRLQSESTA